MTVATTQISETWTGDASSVTFPIPFPFLSREHLVVWKEDAGGVQTAMTISTATGEGEPSGGSITLSEPVGSGFTLHVRRNTTKTQETDYVPNDPFPADSHERALDKLTMIVQELIAAGAIDLDVDTLRGLIGDSSTIVWTLSPDGTKTIASVVDAGMAKNEAGGVSRYHGDLHSNDLDILFRVNPDTGKLDSVMYQGTGLGARLLQVKTDFEFAGWADGYLYGGRGIAAGYAWVGEVGSQEHVRVWRCNDAAAHMYQTRDNWATSVHDTSAVALLVGVRPPCLAYIEIGGVASWILTSSTDGRWWYAQDIAGNYNADGSLKTSAWHGGAVNAPHQIADIAESPDGGFRLVGNHNYIMKTTDWVTFTDVYNSGAILGGIDTDNAGKWIAVDRDAGGIAMSIDDGDTWSWPSVYKRDVEDGEYLPAGNILPSGCVAYANGVWMITSSYNAGYAYSDDGIHWTVVDSPLGEFYGVASDGVRFYATNPTRVGTGAQNVVYRLLVSEIPFHRHTVHEKGATVDGGLWISDLTTGRMVSTTTGGRLQALDAAGSRALIGAQHRNEAVNVTVTYPGPNSGYFLLGTTAEAAIPASRLVEGLVVRIKALADVSVDSGVYFSLIGALSNASTGVYPDTYDSASFGGPIGRWPGFLSGKILFTVEIRLGAITSGTTRLVHYVWSAQADGLAPIFWADGNYPLDVSIPRYPHLAVDLSGNGSINKYVYSVEIQDP